MSRAWAVEHGFSSYSVGSVAPWRVGPFPDQGSNPCPLHWQVGSQSLDTRKVPALFLILVDFIIISIDIPVVSV